MMLPGFPMGMCRYQHIIRGLEMNLIEAAEAIKALYKTPNTSFSSASEVERAWSDAINRFQNALERECDPQILEKCILSDPNWELSVDERLATLEKAKGLGASSKPFLMDYFGYKAAHLPPGPEKEEAALQLKRILPPAV